MFTADLIHSLWNITWLAISLKSKIFLHYSKTIYYKYFDLT